MRIFNLIGIGCVFLEWISVHLGAKGHRMLKNGHRMPNSGHRTTQTGQRTLISGQRPY